MLSPAVAGALVALHWTAGQLFAIAAVPTIAAGLGVLVVLALLRRLAPTTVATVAARL